MVPTKSREYNLTNQEDIDTVVIRCSDGRFQKAFEEYLENELGVQRFHYHPITIPGSIHDLVSISRIKAARHIWEQITFMITKGKVRRVIIFNHEDCKWYEKWKALSFSKVGQDVNSHLLVVVEKLIEKKLKVEIECYLAKIQEGKVVFSRVDK